ncbi:hypothetical protein Tco_0640875, partial [Tanacetum coccineum]
MNNTSGTSVTPQVDKPKLSAVTPFPKKLHAPIPSHSVPRPEESEIVYGTCKQCFVTVNHDACLPSFVNALN